MVSVKVENKIYSSRLENSVKANLIDFAEMKMR